MSDSKELKEQSNTSPIVTYEKEDDKKIQIQKFKKSKVCAGCKNWIIRQKSINCQICEDFYHLSCLRPKLNKKPKKWTCKNCIELKNSFSDTSSEISHINCGRCTKIIENDEEQVCSKCSRFFHLQCYGSKKLAPICIFCEQQKPRIQKQNLSLEQFINQKSIKTHDNSFGLPCCIYDQQLREKCFMSIQYALYCQNIQFNDNLNYDSIESNSNQAELEPSLQSLVGKDLEIFKKFKILTKDGFYGPLIVEYSNEQGFLVRAVQPIAKNTLICEYSGNVYYFAKQVYSTSDSMMSLLETKLAATSLVIIPEKTGNIAKYLSGINNLKKNTKKHQQNVVSRRFNVEGQARVILYACKEIKTGEILYYDYNEGSTHYNTKCFI